MEFGVLFGVPRDHKTIASDNIITNFLLMVLFVTPSTMIDFALIDIPNFGRRHTVLWSYLLGSIVIVFPLFIDDSELYFYFIAGFKCCLVTASNALFVYTIEFYPTPIRATSLGCLAAVSKIFGVIYPLAWAYWPAKDVNFPYISLVFTALLGALLVWFLPVDFFIVLWIRCLMLLRTFWRRLIRIRRMKRYFDLDLIFGYQLNANIFLFLLINFN